MKHTRVLTQTTELCWLFKMISIVFYPNETSELNTTSCSQFIDIINIRDNNNLLARVSNTYLIYKTRLWSFPKQLLVFN